MNGCMEHRTDGQTDKQIGGQTENNIPHPSTGNNDRVVNYDKGYFYIILNSKYKIIMLYILIFILSINLYQCPFSREFIVLHKIY